MSGTQCWVLAHQPPPKDTVARNLNCCSKTINSNDLVTELTMSCLRLFRSNDNSRFVTGSCLQSLGMVLDVVFNKRCDEEV